MQVGAMEEVAEKQRQLAEARSDLSAVEGEVAQMRRRVAEKKASLQSLQQEKAATMAMMSEEQRRLATALGELEVGAPAPFNPGGCLKPKALVGQTHSGRGYRARPRRQKPYKPKFDTNSQHLKPRALGFSCK